MWGCTHTVKCICAARSCTNAPAHGRRVSFMAFKRCYIRQSRATDSDDKPIPVYSLHPAFHSLHLIVIEPQMWGTTKTVK